MQETKTKKWLLVGIEEKKSKSDEILFAIDNNNYIKITPEKIIYNTPKSTLEISKDELLAKCENTKIEIRKDWGYLNNRQILTEPCVTTPPPTIPTLNYVPLSFQIRYYVLGIDPNQSYAYEQQYVNFLIHFRMLATYYHYLGDQVYLVPNCTLAPLPGQDHELSYGPGIPQIPYQDPYYPTFVPPPSLTELKDGIFDRLEKIKNERECSGYPNGQCPQYYDEQIGINPLNLLPDENNPFKVRNELPNFLTAWDDFLENGTDYYHYVPLFYPLRSTNMQDFLENASEIFSDPFLEEDDSFLRAGHLFKIGNHDITEELENTLLFRTNIIPQNNHRIKYTAYCLDATNKRYTRDGVAPPPADISAEGLLFPTLFEITDFLEPGLNTIQFMFYYADTMPATEIKAYPFIYKRDEVVFPSFLFTEALLRHPNKLDIPRMRVLERTPFAITNLATLEYIHNNYLTTQVGWVRVRFPSR